MCGRDWPAAYDSAMDLPWTIVALAVGLAFLGAMVQGLLGFGMGVVSTPILALAHPSLVPVAVILAGAAIPIMSLVDEFRDLDKGILGWAMLGRLPATALGVWIVTAVPSHVLQAIIAVIVLAMVGLNLVKISIPTNRATIFGAGFVSGVSGTATGVGGPPLAMVLAGQPPARVRATLAATFIIGIMVSLTGLFLGGATRPDALVVGLAMLPATVLGMLAARKVRGRLDQRRFKIGILTLSTLSATILLVQALT